MLNTLQDLISPSDIARVAESEGLHFDGERTEILESISSIDVQACPGSGKTTLIAAKLILLAEKWQHADRGICVLSHTNVAKNEIIDRLKKSKITAAQRLLEYPHFIGTIQGFIGKFVAFPLIRSDGKAIQLVDTDACVELIYKRIKRKTKSYLDRRGMHSNVLYDFDLDYNGSLIKINVPTFKNSSKSDSYMDLLAVRNSLLDSGHFFYRDIFAFANMDIMENSRISNALRKRFPCVLLDEMQDTQKFQDDLLCEIFPLKCADIIVQRFGDPDQAIFNGVNGEKANETFNGKSCGDMDFVINKSHRFDNSVAAKAKSMSLNQVPLETEISDAGLAVRKKAHVTNEELEHTIILFNDETRSNVVETFAQIVSSQFTSEYKSSGKFLVKAVGGVGNEIDPNEPQLKIGHYWADYDKSKATSNFKEKRLIDAVRHCQQSQATDWSENYKLIIDCLLKLMRLAGKKDQNGRYFSATTLREYLEENGDWVCFRKVTLYVLNEAKALEKEMWGKIIIRLKKLLHLDQLSAVAGVYLEFLSEEKLSVPTVVQEDECRSALTAIEGNKIKHADGFEIELSTIHGVKGETHDATLVLETKNYNFDLESMLPHLSGEVSSKPTGIRKPKFMRQLYVAMSRPKHLLCLAMHSERISEPQRVGLGNAGWKIEFAGVRGTGV